MNKYVGGIISISALLVGILVISQENRTNNQVAFNGSDIADEIKFTVPTNKPETLIVGSDRTNYFGVNALISEEEDTSEVYTENIEDEVAHEVPMPSRAEMMQHFKEEVIAGMGIDDVGGLGTDFGRKVHSNNPQETVSLSELPPPLANQLREELAFKKENGYEPVTEEDVYNTKSMIDQLSGRERNIPGLEFELTAIPDSFESQYGYEGYIYPRALTVKENQTYESVKRVFKNRYGIDYIVIEEETLQHGSSHVTTEFVNASVRGCPAILGVKRAKSGAGYGTLNWASTNYSYTIFRMQEDNPLDGLLNFANQIADLNKTTHDCGKSISKKGQVDTDEEMIPADAEVI